MFDLSPSQVFLCSVLGGYDLSTKEIVLRLKEDIGDEKAFSLARANDVISIVAHKLMDVMGSDNVYSQWEDVHKRTYTRLSGYLEELDRTASRLSEKDIPLVALKNGGIARGIYPCAGCCPMGDLDILVEKRHFRRAHRLLIEDGYQFGFRSPLEEAELQAAEDSGGAEYWKVLPNGEKLWLELQWRPVAGRWIRPDQEPSAEELMARSIPIPGTAVRLLSPEDNLLQVALHTAKHTYVRAPGFRLHLDVERIVGAYPDLDWDIFLKRVEKLQVKTAVYFSLAIPKEIFQTVIPDMVLSRLRPPFWKERLLIRWLNYVGLFNPDEKKFGKIGYVLFNALLYDDLKGLLRSVFPKRDWMAERYGTSNGQKLPVLYIRRLMDLALRRVNT